MKCSVCGLTSFESYSLVADHLLKEHLGYARDLLTAFLVNMDAAASLGQRHD